MSRSSRPAVAVAAVLAPSAGAVLAEATAAMAVITMARTVATPTLGRLSSDEMVSPARSDQVENSGE
ncbi:MAG: hypothetical protein QOE61_702 [Micromonosporaceae bacterium]|nr:hypothetical protein [Micromonosporaceae bacterium]